MFLKKRNMRKADATKDVKSPPGGSSYLVAASGEVLEKETEVTGNDICDGEMAGKLQLEEIVQYESDMKGVSRTEDSLICDELLTDVECKEIENSQEGIDENTALEHNSGDERGQIHITNSEDYVDS
ncbi:hypothetical protein GUJ93_ZPchr0011g27915 [Zizania palustris]|uniref:Uncharacterized protein n=1 Tax=Zizania palustris TaxID=103762 RepID=A0A8J6BNT5_ZIZPA|nr:hypothetical protein GUJ93_ZPchr0011g27915 [Zizania palustris]